MRINLFYKQKKTASKSVHWFESNGRKRVRRWCMFCQKIKSHLAPEQINRFRKFFPHSVQLSLARHCVEFQLKKAYNFVIYWNFGKQMVK